MSCTGFARENMLTLQAYRDLGGMEGALTRRADEVFAKLPDSAKSALPHIFRRLVTIGATTMRPPLATGPAGGVRRARDRRSRIPGSWLQDVARPAIGGRLRCRAAADRQKDR